MFRCALLLCFVASIAAVAAKAETELREGGSRPKRPLVLSIQLDGDTITPGTARYIQRAIRQAEDRRAECLVIVLDTPGGVLDSTREVVKSMLASRTCVAVYVAPSGSRAASAGLFIVLASHVAAMAPGTTIGAAHPVQVGGLPAGPEPEDDGTRNRQDDAAERRQGRSTVEEKIVNDTVSWARSLADQRDRNADWAAKAVSESLSITASEALEERVIDLVAADFDELLEKLDGREVLLAQGPKTLEVSRAEVETIPMWWGERLLSVIAHPNIAFLLLIFGFYGVLFELYSPGWGVAGTLGVVCLLLGLFGLAVLPVDYLGLALIAIALALFVAEAFVTSFGALTVAGAACLVLGAVMLIDSPVGFTRVSVGVALPIAAATAVISLFLFGGVVRAHRRRVLTGSEELLGSTARAKGGFTGRDGQFVGRVHLHGEFWRAVSDRPIADEELCVVQQREGLTLVVEPARRPTAAEPP